MPRQSNSLWVEKYRPDSLDTFIGNDDLKIKIEKFITEQDIPNLLFVGPPGVGKTTLSKILINEIPCEYIYINASDENGVETVRTKIKNFASSIGFADLKIVVLDECDQISMSGQAALRNLIETFSKHCRFIFTANYIERLIDPLISRTQQLYVTPPSQLEVAKHLAKILKTEGIVYSPDNIRYLIDAYFPDIRKIIGEASLASINGQLQIDVGAIVASDIKLKIVDILKSTDKINKNKIIREIRQLIANAGTKDFIDLYRILYDRVDEYGKDNISQIILHIAEGERWDGQVVNKEINAMATLTNIIDQL